MSELNTATENAITENTEQEAQQTFTLEEVNAMLQKEGDRRVQSAMEKKQREIASLKKQIENQKTLSELDADARATAEKDMEIAELREQLKDFQLTQNKSEVMKVLNARGLSAEFAEVITIGEDAEVNQQRIEALDKLIKREITAEVKRRLAETSAVPTLAQMPSGKITKEEFRKMSLMEKQAIYDNDIELYRELTR